MAEARQNDEYDAKHDRESVIEKQSIHRFGERLKIAMNGISNMELSRRSGLSETTIRKYVQGKIYPGLDSLALVAEACGVSLAWLATGNDNSNKSSKDESGTTYQAREGAPQAGNDNDASKELEAIFRRLTNEDKNALIDTIYRIGIEGLLNQLKAEQKDKTTAPKNDVPPAS
ncbi:helix-turn-helix transcriptional regulator [Brenneria sp. g21c3]|uniref:helix-turn-helix domain-containing protein n=1 Tax=Brenneria sp. g21c3 TaxID=3093893 RepID=UPI002EB796C8|nr:helix-turn-helix transcriptional regulator [Brenneria sp. g21c3]